MTKIINFIGIDIGAETFVSSIYQSPTSKIATSENIDNTNNGFKVLITWLTQYNVTNANSIICMEATGVYCEALAYYLVAKGYSVAIEPPLKVKRAFDPVGHKTDAVDSKQIAEYAYRYNDELRFWKPKDETIEKIKHLLTAHEQFTKQKVAVKNALNAYEKHITKVPMIIKAHKQTLKQLEKHIADIDKELNRNIHQNPDVFQKTSTLKSISGFGMLLSAHLVAITDGFNTIDNYKSLASFIGIAPYKHQSGISIHKKDRSRKYGPASARKLLRLAAQSVSMHDEQFRKYYLRKLAEGKQKALVLNNIANKLLKIAYAMVKSNNQYIKNYQSVNPMYLKMA